MEEQQNLDQENSQKISPKKALIVNLAAFVIASLAYIYDYFIDGDEYVSYILPILVITTFFLSIYFAIKWIKESK